MRQILRLWPDRVKATGEHVEMCATCLRPLSAAPPSLPGGAEARGYWCGCSILGRHVGLEEGREAEHRWEVVQREGRG